MFCIFGDDDQIIPIETVHAFESALDALGVKDEIHIYQGVCHAFANPSGADYAPKATMVAWQKSLSFLDENLERADMSR